MGAERGALTVMASGDEDAFRRVTGVMEAFAGSQFHLGATGNGTLVKLINNAIFLGGGLILQEGFVMGAKAGLDVEQLLEILKKSSGAAYAGMAGLLLGRNFENVIFKLGIAAKDLSLAASSGAGPRRRDARHERGGRRLRARRGDGTSRTRASSRPSRRSSGSRDVEVPAVEG